MYRRDISSCTRLVHTSIHSLSFALRCLGFCHRCWQRHNWSNLVARKGEREGGSKKGEKDGIRGGMYERFGWLVRLKWKNLQSKQFFVSSGFRFIWPQKSQITYSFYSRRHKMRLSDMTSSNAMRGWEKQRWIGGGCCIVLERECARLDGERRERTRGGGMRSV